MESRLDDRLTTQCSPSNEWYWQQLSPHASPQLQQHMLAVDEPSSYRTRIPSGVHHQSADRCRLLLPYSFCVVYLRPLTCCMFRDVLMGAVPMWYDVDWWVLVTFIMLLTNCSTQRFRLKSLVNLGRNSPCQKPKPKTKDIHFHTMAPNHILCDIQGIRALARHVREGVRCKFGVFCFDTAAFLSWFGTPSKRDEKTVWSLMIRRI